MIGASVLKLVNVELVMKEFIQRVGILLVDGVSTQLEFTCSKLTIETRTRCQIYSKLTIKTPERLN